MGYRYDIHRTENYSTRESYGYGSEPDGFTIHHWGRDGQHHDDVVYYLAETSDGSSAHEVISDGRVSHLLDFHLAAWHAGSDEANGRFIALECRPEMSNGDLETLAQRCADIENQLGKSMYYNIHSDWYATTCPGRYRDRIEWLVNRVNEIHNGEQDTVDESLGDVMPMVPIYAPAGKGWHAVGVPAKNRSTSLVVDGVWLSFSPLFARANDVKVGIYDEYAKWMNPETGNVELGYVEANDTVYWQLPDGAASARIEWRGNDDKLVPNVYIETRGK